MVCDDNYVTGVTQPYGITQALKNNSNRVPTIDAFSLVLVLVLVLIINQSFTYYHYLK